MIVCVNDVSETKSPIRTIKKRYGDNVHEIDESCIKTIRQAAKINYDCNPELIDEIINTWLDFTDQGSREYFVREDDSRGYFAIGKNISERKTVFCLASRSDLIHKFYISEHQEDIDYKEIFFEDPGMCITIQEGDKPANHLPIGIGGPHE